MCLLSEWMGGRVGSTRLETEEEALEEKGRKRKDTEVTYLLIIIAISGTWLEKLSRPRELVMVRSDSPAPRLVPQPCGLSPWLFLLAVASTPRHATAGCCPRTPSAPWPPTSRFGGQGLGSLSPHPSPSPLFQVEDHCPFLVLLSIDHLSNLFLILLNIGSVS